MVFVIDRTEMDKARVHTRSKTRPKTPHALFPILGHTHGAIQAYWRRSPSQRQVGIWCYGMAHDALLLLLLLLFLLLLLLLSLVLHVSTAVSRVRVRHLARLCRGKAPLLPHR